MGASSTITREPISGFASINRDLQDYARLDPRLAQTDKERGEISALGQNTRFNSITIDGVSINDTFGLNANGLPTNRQPISIDAIEQLEVNVSNYDVKKAKYTDANHTAVPTSRRNDFQCSLLYFDHEDRIGGVDKKEKE